MEKELQEILDKYRENPDAVTEEEKDSILEHIGDQGEDSEFDFKQLQGILTDMFNDPEYQAKLQEAQRKGEISGNLSKGINLALDAVDVGISVDQILTAKQELAGIKKPTPPPTRRRSPELASALDQARRRSEGGFSEDIEPFTTATQEGFQADLEAAKTASAGQAGAFGAGAQAAASRRNRSLLQSIPLAGQLRGQAESRFDRLLSGQLREDESIAGSEERRTAALLDQYNLEAQAAGALGATGRSNLRGALGRFAGSAISPLTSGLYNLEQGGQLRGLRRRAGGLSTLSSRGFNPIQTGFGSDIDDYANRVRGSLLNRVSG